MILSAHSLTLAQRCPRRWKIEQFQPLWKWPHKALFDATLRRAIVDLSQPGADKGKVTLQAQTSFREVAKNPGLENVEDPWTVAQDYCACLATILEWISREKLPELEIVGEPYLVGPEVYWRVSEPRDRKSGVLHRWVTMSRFTEDGLSRELHSWAIAGDMAVTGSPLQLHIVEIGELSGGRRRSPWCLTYKHPHVAGRVQFQRRGGKSLQGDWRPLWYDGRQDPVEWVDLMQRDKITPIRHVLVGALTEDSRKEVQGDIVGEAGRLGGLLAWEDVPRFRPACDFPYTCPWQELCYKGQ